MSQLMPTNAVAIRHPRITRTRRIPNPERSEGSPSFGAILLSGSSALRAEDLRGQIVPLRVHCFDERVLFCSRPSLDLLFACTGGVDVVEFFPIDELVAVVFLREAGEHFVFVLREPAFN